MARYEERLDRVFSLYIRLKYANHAGYVRCFTCNVVIEWQESQCGHFILRSNDATRYDEQNCRPQCFICNMHRNGMPEAFEERLREDLGDEEVDNLIERGRTSVQLGDKEYQHLLDKYTRLVRQMGGNI